MEDVDPHALGGPPDKTIVERLVWSIRVWRVFPAAPRLQHVDDPADHRPVVNTRLAAGVGRKQRSEPLELSLGQPELVSMHDDLPSQIVESDPP